METLYVTLYPGPRTLVNGLLLEIEKDLLHLRLSGELEQLDTLYATLWLEPEPLNCHLCILESTDDPVTGELRAVAKPVDLSREARRYLSDRTKSVSVSSA
jgi:hypothetical protein